MYFNTQTYYTSIHDHHHPSNHLHPFDYYTSYSYYYLNAVELYSGIIFIYTFYFYQLASTIWAIKFEISAFTINLEVSAVSALDVSNRWQIIPYPSSEWIEWRNANEHLCKIVAWSSGALSHVELSVGGIWYQFHNSGSLRSKIPASTSMMLVVEDVR